MSYGFVPERLPKVKCAWVGIMNAKVLIRKIAIVTVAISFLLNYHCPTIGKRILDARSVRPIMYKRHSRNPIGLRRCGFRD